jgi:hypothetical protein
VLVAVGIIFAGYRLHRASESLEWYKRTYGYATPTIGLPDCVMESSSWKGILLDSAIVYTDGAHNIQPFDIDGDGDLELVADAYRSDTLIIYDPGQNPHDPRGWTRSIIGSRVGGGFPRHPAAAFVKASIKRALIGIQMEGGHYTAIGDLNGDGRNDLVVAGDLARYDVTWFEAVPHDGNKPGSWMRHIAYEDDSHRTYHVETGDIDGDGRRDIVFATKTDNSVGWLENRGASGPWPAVIVDANCTRAFYVRAIDLDKDGKAEIVASQDDAGSGGRLCLYAHCGNPREAKNWSKHAIAHLPGGHGISVFTAVDLDGDGNPDIVGANHQGDVVVLKNPWPGDVLGSWDTYFARRDSAGHRRDFREVDVGDIDLDGDPDVVVADETGNAVVWYENPGETFQADWQEHVVDQSDVYLRWCHCVRLADIDKDGDLDIAVAAAGSNVFLLYLNQMPPRDKARLANVTSRPR